MNYKQCLIFHEVAHRLNFTKAAEALYITQSAVSHAIKDLEEEAGTPLFERLHRSVKLTTAGRLFLKEVTPLIATFEKTERHLHRLQHVQPIDLAVCMTYAEVNLPTVIEAFRQRYPEVQLKIHILPAKECFRMLAEAQVDLAIIEGQLPQNDFMKQTLIPYPLVAIGTEAGPAKLTLPQLLKERLLMREPGSAPRDSFDAFLTLVGLEATPIWESADTKSLITATSKKMGISILPEPLVKEALQAGIIKEIVVPELKVECPVTAVIREAERLEGPLAELWGLFRKEEKMRSYHH